MTWVGKRRTHTVASWIDRAMANDEWRVAYPASEVEYLQLIESDHRPGIIKIRKKSDQGFRPFRFGSRLCQLEGFENVIEEGWTRVGEYETILVSERIKACRKTIADWKSSHTRNSAIRIKEISAQIDEAHSDPSSTLQTIYNLRRELITAYRDEETYWQIKSQNQWLRKGDRNTRFYHATTKNRRARNRIVTLKNGYGEDIYGNREIAKEAKSYFRDLFSTSGQRDLNTVLTSLDKVVTEDMNLDLTRNVTVEEIKKALYSIGASRAPGPDGFTTGFYQNYWNIVGPAIVTEVRRFF